MTYGHSLDYTRLQPQSHTVTASITYGDSLYYIRRQPLLHTVTGPLVLHALGLCPDARSPQEAGPAPAGERLAFPPQAHRDRLPPLRLWPPPRTGGGLVAGRRVACFVRARSTRILRAELAAVAARANRPDPLLVPQVSSGPCSNDCSNVVSGKQLVRMSKDPLFVP